MTPLPLLHIAPSAWRPHRLLARVAGLLALLATSTLFAQPLTLADSPNLDLRTNGLITAVVRQPNGGVVIGGEFSSVDGVPRRHLARLRPDGSLDPQWKPEPDGRIESLAVLGNQFVVAAGDFRSIGGGVRRQLAKLRGGGNGSLVSSWSPPYVSGLVYGVTAHSSGTVFVYGVIQVIDGVGRNGIAKLDADSGALVTAWNAPLPNGTSITHAVVDGSGHVYVSGRFDSVGGVARLGLAKLHANTGALIAGWNPSLAGPYGINGPLLLDGQGFLYTTAGSRTQLRKLSTTNGSPAPGWSSPIPQASFPLAIALDPGVGVYLAYKVEANEPLSTYRLTRRNPDTGAQDAAFQLTLPATSMPAAMAIGHAGEVVLGGDFGVASGRTRLGVARIARDAQPLDAPQFERPGQVNAIVSLPDGGQIIGGSFWKVGSQSRWNLLRLDRNGRLSPNWSNAAVNGPVNALALEKGPNGRLFIGGRFTSVLGTARAFVAAMRPSTVSLVDGWNATPDDSVKVMALHDDGSLLVSGDFWTINGARRSVAKLASHDGSVVTSWNPPVGNLVDDIAIDTDGSVYLAASFTDATNRRVGKVRADTGALIPAWNPAPDASVMRVIPDRHGGVYLIGHFRNAGGRPRENFTKVSATNGQTPAAWIGPGHTFTVNQIGIAPNGAVHAATVVDDVVELSSLTGTVDRVVASFADFVYPNGPIAYGDDGSIHLTGARLLFTAGTRIGIATLSHYPDRIFADGFD